MEQTPLVVSINFPEVEVQIEFQIPLVGARFFLLRAIVGVGLVDFGVNYSHVGRSVVKPYLVGDDRVS